MFVAGGKILLRGLRTPDLEDKLLRRDEIAAAAAGNETPSLLKVLLIFLLVTEFGVRLPSNDVFGNESVDVALLRG